jgi:serine/threonine-protein kinase RsbW
VEHAQKTFKLSVPSDTENLAMIREFLDRTARRSPISDQDLERLKLAVNEACENVIKHAYGNDMTRDLTLHVWLEDVQIAVVDIDSGHRFAPMSHKPLELD